MIVGITGGTGFLGRHLARALVASGHYAKLIARGIDRSDEELKRIPNVAFAALSLTDDSKLFQGLSGCDAVIHLAGISRENAPGDFQKLHVESTMHVLHAARKCGAKKFIYMSMLKARPKTRSKYHQSKWDAEEMIRTSELNYTIMKPGIVYGWGDHFVNQIVSALDKIPMFPTVGILEKPMRPVYVRDIVHAMIQIILEPGRLERETVAVLGPEEITFGNAVRRIARVSGRPAIVMPTPAVMQLAFAALKNVGGIRMPSQAEVTMLLEGLGDPLPGERLLSGDLAPNTPFGEEQILASLSPTPTC